MPGTLTETNWYFETDMITVPEGGIILKNVRNQGHNFAKSIEVNKIWINAESANPIALTLGPAEFDIEGVTHKKASAQSPIDTSGLKNFSKYPATDILQAKFTSRQPVMTGGSKITITQTYIFTDYSKYPPHEPGGVLTAARIFPLIKFEVPDESQLPADKRIYSVRADYKFHLSLDVFLKGTSWREALKDAIGKEPGIEDWYTIINRPQQAGVFKDNDNGLPVADGITAAQVTFDAVEKPLVYEIISRGVLNEADTTAVNQSANGRSNWDNIHWWGGTKDFHIPSAPGAFHAAHLHWRWGKSLQTLPRLFSPAHSGEQQFRGFPYGGPLVDPFIPKQNLKFAVFKDLDPKKISLFNSIIQEPTDDTKDGLPDNIREGAPLVLLYSTEALRSSSKAFSGTLFIHGIFFAHEPEPGFFTFGVGQQGEKYSNPSKPEQKWFRYPEQ